MSNPPVHYLENPAVAALVNASPAFVKSAQTLLRQPAPSEEGAELNTYVRDHGTAAYYSDGDTTTRIESKNTITSDKVIARNPGPHVGLFNREKVFNECLIDRSVAVENYGETVINGLSNEFTSHHKVASIKAVELDASIMKELGVDGDTLEIAVDWSPEPVKAKLGDWLTSGGYCVSASDFASTYQREDKIAPSFVEAVAARRPASGSPDPKSPKPQ